MRFTSTLLTALVAILPLSSVVSAPAPILEVQRFSGETRPGSFIITLKKEVDKSVWLARRPNFASRDFNSTFINGFASILDEDALQELRANPDIESIAEDGIMRTMVTVTQNNAPWGLSRISQNAPVNNQSPTALTNVYRFDSTAGEGVDVYILDTGILTTHVDFGGRARWGATFGEGLQDADGNGHGTHVAATAVGRQFGVAKNANVIAVKVLADDGAGTVSDIISGLNFVAVQARVTGRPTVASLSLGGGISTALDNAVIALTRVGVHVTVAAGNENQNAGNVSPARAGPAITVGATTAADVRAEFSNFGAVVDIFAPGQGITSAWAESNTATNTISGTSMATPHVAGFIAYIIGLRGNMSPAEMQSLIQRMSLKGAIRGLPSGTVNGLLRNDI